MIKQITFMSGVGNDNQNTTTGESCSNTAQFNCISFSSPMHKVKKMKLEYKIFPLLCATFSGHSKSN